MGTSAPTADQLLWLKDDGGLLISELDDATITRYWSRVSAADSDNIQFEATLGLIARSFLAKNVDLADQQAGNTSEKLSQMWSNAKSLWELYKPSLDLVLGIITPEVAIGNIRSDKRPPAKPAEWWADLPGYLHEGQEFVPPDWPDWPANYWEAQ